MSAVVELCLLKDRPVAHTAEAQPKINLAVTVGRAHAVKLQRVLALGQRSLEPRARRGLVHGAHRTAEIFLHPLRRRRVSFGQPGLGRRCVVQRHGDV